MKHLIKFIAILILVAGLGHIYLALAYDSSAMQMQVLGGGSFYILLAIFVWFKKKLALIISMLFMLMATVSTVPIINEMGYPVSLLSSFMVINVLVIISSTMYLIKTRKSVLN